MFKRLLSLFVGLIQEVCNILRNILVITNFFVFDGIREYILTQLLLRSFSFDSQRSIRPLWVRFGSLNLADAEYKISIILSGGFYLSSDKNEDSVEPVNRFLFSSISHGNKYR